MIRVTLITLIALLTPFPIAAEDLGGHILSRMEEKALLVQSYRADFDLSIHAGEEMFSLVGTTQFRRPKMLRVEMGLRDQKELRQVLYWKEGIVWQYFPSSKVAFHLREGRLREKFPGHFASQDLLNIQDPFDLVQNQTIQFLDEEQIEGETVYLFEGIPKKAIQDQGLFHPVLCRMRIAARDGLLRAFFLYDAAGREIMKQEFRNIQPNVELPEEAFEFKPEDVKLVEVTKYTEKKMRLLFGEEPSSSGKRALP